MNLDLFLEDLSENQKEIILFLHQQFLDYPEIQCKFRYHIPFFYFKSWLCYLNPKNKIDGFELVFIYGKRMYDESGLLEVRGRKQVAGIMINSLDEILISTINELFAQAIILDEEIAAARKRK